MEFSYDSRNRAEVARESGNIVDIRATVLPNAGRDHRLFLKGKQSAAVQLELSFLFEQTQWSSGRCGIEKIAMWGGITNEKTARRRFHPKWILT
ncbi:hypothetical protein RI103_18860 [Paraburkholderia sp. FT54]|uniref:hypothetical protein n=1 Tax=Paraburkholderia sp. FT54 TaxID=3074437 RepID=UPI0028780A9E|nr:hypothetical protein [Paraburkholderia sp. FT54]WNC89705.1 hypothetical protein RI103_18860 [Paraburkholderia sp. FT54]